MTVSPTWTFPRILIPHEADAVPLAERAVDDADIGDHAPVVVVLAVEDERPQRGFGVPFGSGNALDDGFDALFDADAGLGADAEGVGGVQPDDVLDFLAHLVDARDGEVDLIDDGDDFEVGLDRRIGIGDGLRLDPLKGVDDQQGAFAGGEAAGDFVVEVDVAGGVDEIQLVLLPLVDIVDGDRARFDGDPAFPFDVEVVEELGLKVPFFDGAAFQQELIGERALAVINVGDNRKIAYLFRLHDSDISESSLIARRDGGPCGRVPGAARSGPSARLFPGENRQL